MKAIVNDRYGLDALRLEEIDKPTIKDGEVLVRVRAASVNPADVAVAAGVPAIARLALGLRRPKVRIRGYDFAGVVESVGSAVTSVKPGDEVYGQGRGSFADFVVAAEKALVPKPVNLSFDEAAAVPMVGLVSIQVVRDKGKVKPGQKVLVIGAGGGIGSFAVQIAKAFGAEVTGVCGPDKVELVRSLGADHVIDYTKTDFTRDAVKYDLILDNVSNRPLMAMRRVMARKGVLVMNGGEFRHRIVGPMGRLMRGMVLSVVVRRRFINLLSMSNQADLLELKELIEAGKVKPVIGRTLALAEVPAAIAEVAAGHTRGKLVVTVSH